MTDLELTWLRQAGFSICTDSLRLAIDLFLSPHPARVAEPPSIERLDRLVVPMHWDAFAGNTVRPGAFVDAVVDGAFWFMCCFPRPACRSNW